MSRFLEMCEQMVEADLNTISEDELLTAVDACKKEKNQCAYESMVSLFIEWDYFVYGERVHRFPKLCK